MQVNASDSPREKRARKWMWVGLAVFVALQIYFVQAMLAALLLFTVAFAIFAAGALLLYGVDRVGQRSLGWAGERARPAAQLARRGWVVVEDVSKKQFRRLRSQPVP